MKHWYIRYLNANSDGETMSSVLGSDGYTEIDGRFRRGHVYVVAKERNYARAAYYQPVFADSWPWGLDGNEVIYKNDHTMVDF
jgi:hypothetical protein